jgi:hypothetical protein
MYVSTYVHSVHATECSKAKSVNLRQAMNDDAGGDNHSDLISPARSSN